MDGPKPPPTGANPPVGDPGGASGKPPATATDAALFTTSKTTKASASPRAAAGASPPRTLRETVHTSVLGRDAGDSERIPSGAGGSSKQGRSSRAGGSGPYQPIASPGEPAASQAEHGWWGTRLFGGANGREDRGGSKGDAEGSNGSSHARKQRRSGKARYSGIDQEVSRYDPPPQLPAPTDATVASTSASTATSTATREDRVREDCSYFYRGMEEHQPQAHPADPHRTAPFHKTKTHRGSGRTAAAANSLLRRMSVRARLSGSVDGALFMSKYERLNQVIDSPRHKHRRARGSRHERGQPYTGNDNTQGHNHDLFLDEETVEDEVGGNADSSSSYREHIPSPTNNVVMDPTLFRANRSGQRVQVRSSMFFEQDGRMLMRLPRDQVRLVMDYNLEPGILSVEQWRSKEEADRTIERMAVSADAATPRTKGGPNHGSQTERWRRDREKRRLRREKERERRLRRRQKRKEKKQKKKLLREKAAAATAKNDTDGSATEDRDASGHDPGDSSSSSSSSWSSSDSDASSSCDTYLDYDLEEGRPGLAELPELKYVITVPDDLYRRMVGEMSAKIFPPAWGFFKCCHQESERADIKLALVILAVVMALLFVGSLEWRTT